MAEPDEKVVQVREKDLTELMELLDGYKTMLLGHERRIGIIEQVLIDALPKKTPQDHLPPRRKT